MKSITFTAHDLLYRAKEKLDTKAARYLENAFDDALGDMCRELGKLHDHALRKLHEIEWQTPDEPDWEKTAAALEVKGVIEVRAVDILRRARELNEKGGSPPWMALEIAMGEAELKLDALAEKIAADAFGRRVNSEHGPDWDTALDKARSLSEG